VHVALRSRRSRGAASALVATGLVILGVTLGLFALAAARFSANVGAASLGGSNVTVWLLHPIASPIGLATGATGDLAAQSNTNLLGLVASAALNSTFLLVPAALFAALIGVPLGFWIALHAPAWAVGLLRALTNLGIALPAFFVAFLLQVVAVELDGRVGRSVVPVYGFGLDAHLLIPVLALAIGPAAAITRLVALSATELNARDFARTARAKGLSERSVIYGHLVPNMYGILGEAVLTGIRLVLGALVIVEFLFVWPGLGVLAVRALNVQDLPVLLGCVAILGSLFVLVELGLDVITARTGLVTG
jgi:peptide/nickel transport system permease protein